MLMLPSLELHAGTLVFSVAALSLSMSAVSFSAVVGDLPTGLKEWGVAMACASIAFFFYFLRSSAPFFITYVLANALMALVFAFGLMAYAKFLRVSIPAAWIYWGIGFALSGVLVVATFGTSNRVSVFTMNASMAVANLYAAYLFHRERAALRTKLTWITQLALVSMGGTFAARSVWAAFNDTASLNLSSSNLPHVSAFLIGGWFIVLSTVGFIALVKERELREAMRRLRRDSLTSLYTRTAFFESKDEIQAFGLAHDYAVVMLDIDHFKSVNDEFGHAGGDAALAQVGRLIANSVRISDLAARYGGEEFCILLRDCTREQAQQFAERLVQETRNLKMCLRDGREIRVTISAGYAWKVRSGSANAANEALEDVIARADDALYTSKDEGRDRASQSVPAPLLAS